MKAAPVFLIVTCALLAYAAASPAKSDLKKKPILTCIKDCGDLYKPICVGDGTGKGDKSFGSECVLQNYNCENKDKAMKMIGEGECPGGGGVRLS